MGLSAFFQSAALSKPSFNPASIPGLKLGLQPSGLVASNNRITGWLNTATQQVLVADGLYTGNDVSFNNLATMKLEGIGGAYGYMDGVDLGTVVDGITIVMVAKVIPVTRYDMMWWFISASNGPLDLWNTNGNNMYYNTFDSTQFGVAGCVPDISETQIITNTITNNGVYDSKIYVNGMLKNMNTNTGRHVPISLTGGLFRLGDCFISRDYNFQGKYSTVLVYNRILDANELNTVHTALKADYSL